ncbi:hypothetical protein SNE40_015127 [Patella caerulea]|uniref:Protein kinase domain-containing protein n=1 Tax=Patella caerulea TaxID=87958 RepID=A0AAN8PK84_PATCE
MYPVVKGGLQSSSNYTWNQADLLGKGATADVYLGRKKDNGEVVAVKQFRSNVRFGHSSEVEMRELDLLRKLKHENIITLYDIERQSSTGVLVIIMEYCEGGSLHALLDQPQYNFGLPEELFLLVLKNVVDGIKYLSSIGIIHRDIKPGNIMRCFTESGKVSFKLTDFGAARELEEEENFTSMYGTEEYLYPAMYETAVLHLPTGQQFDGKVDLWSLGVTFYHSATGKLPFLPYGGRNNRETMFKIISQKESGVISGVQHFESGPIHWSRELPQTCLLSGGLKSILVPLLSGLMETNQHKMLSHDQLFGIVNNICGKIALKIFHYAMCTDLRVYVDKNESYCVIQDCIAGQTDIPAHEQVLLLDTGRPLEHEIDITAPISTYPKSILNSRFYIYNCTITEPHDLKFHDMPTFPDFSATYVDYERDSKLAFQCCSRTNFIKRVIENIVTKQKCLVEGEICLRNYITSKSVLTGESFLGIERVLRESKKRFTMFFSLLEIISGILKTTGQSRELDELLSDKTMLTVHEKAEERKNDIAKYKAVFVDRLDDLRIKTSTWYAVCDEESCMKTVNHYCENITTTLGRFRRDKNVRSQMSTHDEKIHRFEREKLKSVCTKNFKLLDDHCCTNLQKLFREAIPNLFSLVKAHGRIVKIERNIESVVDCQQLLGSRLDKLIEKAEIILKKIQPPISYTTPAQPYTASHYRDEGIGESCSAGNPSVNQGNQIVTECIAEMTQDTREMEHMAEQTSFMLTRFSNLLQEPFFSDGSIGNVLDVAPTTNS